MQADGKEKREKERRLCSTAEEALLVTPPPRRGVAAWDGRAREDRMATAATTALSATNHTASDPSHAGSDGHHRAAAIVGQARWDSPSRARLLPRTALLLDRGRERLDSKEALLLRQLDFVWGLEYGRVEFI